MLDRDDEIAARFALQEFLDPTRHVRRLARDGDDGLARGSHACRGGATHVRPVHNPVRQPTERDQLALREGHPLRHLGEARGDPGPVPVGEAGRRSKVGVLGDREDDVAGGARHAQGHALGRGPTAQDDPEAVASVTDVEIGRIGRRAAEQGESHTSAILPR
jgi:hypothetical protein